MEKKKLPSYIFHFSLYDKYNSMYDHLQILSILTLVKDIDGQGLELCSTFNNLNKFKLT